MNDDTCAYQKSYKIHINPSTIYRFFLIILFFGEIYFFYYFYSSPDLIVVHKFWKTYLYIAILFPILLVFITSIVVESFHILFCKEKEREQKNQSCDKDNQLKCDQALFSFRRLFSRCPYLLQLMLLIIVTILCYYLRNAVFSTIETVNMFIYMLFICLIAFIILFFVYAAIRMIFDYQMNIKKIELHYIKKQKMLEPFNRPLHDDHAQKKMTHSQ